MTGHEAAFEGLSAIQREVVLAPRGRLVFLGGAGAGKSLAVAERAARLFGDGIARPEQVLILAPSRRVAQELRERVRVASGATPTASSFHGFALAVLRGYYREMGYPRLVLWACRAEPMGRVFAGSSGITSSRRSTDGLWKRW